MALHDVPVLLVYVLVVLGAAVLLQILSTFLGSLWAKFLRPSKNLKKYGAWAVITGATDGIGKAFAMGLAKKGLNVFLISRTKSKLEDTQRDILSKYPKVDVKILDIDYSHFYDEARHRVTSALTDLDVGILINNVGVSYPFCKYFHELTDTEVKGLVELNVNSTTWMTRIVLPTMLQKKKGAIVNISSTAGVVPSPLLAEYTAAKSYIEMFTKALAVEYASKGIHFQCQVPLFVTTKLAKIRHSSLFVPTPAGYVASALRCIGYETVCSPYWTHALQLWALKSLPSLFANYILLSMHLAIRSKGMKKDSEKSH